MEFIGMVWLFLGLCSAIALLGLGRLDELGRVLLLWLICLIGGTILAIPAISVLIYHNQGKLLSSLTTVEWLDEVDPDIALEFIVVIATIWCALLPLLLMGSVLRSIMQSNLPSFIEDFQEQKAYEEQLTQTEE